MVLTNLIVSSNALDQYIDLMGEDGKELIIDIIDAMIQDFPRNFSELEQSYREKNYKTFQRSAHTLKTNCATVGAIDLANRFLELERSGSNSNLTSIAGLLTECKLLYAQLKDELMQKKRSLMLNCDVNF